MKAHRKILDALAPLAEAFQLHLEIDRKGHGAHSHPRIIVTHKPSDTVHEIVIASSGRSDETSQANFSKQNLRRLITAQGWCRAEAPQIAPPLPRPINPVRLAPHNGPASDRSSLMAGSTIATARVAHNPVDIGGIVEVPTTKDEPVTEPTAEPKITRTFISLAQQITVMNRLEAVITKWPDNTCEYHEGHSDQTVADAIVAELGIACTKGNVRGVREQLFGLIRRAPPAARHTNGDQQLADRIQKLERAFCALVDRLGENPDQLACNELLAQLLETD